MKKISIILSGLILSFSSANCFAQESNPDPVVFSLAPNYGYIGQTMNIVFHGHGFLSSISSVNNVAGVSINSANVSSDTTFTLNISISPGAITGTRKFAITNIPPDGGISDSMAFSIFGEPVASFYASFPTITCNIGSNTEFYNLSTNGLSYQWDFGSGASPAMATGSGPYTVSYSTTGQKTVRLIVLSPIGNDTLTRINYIKVMAQIPTAPISISGPTSVCSYGTSNVVYTTPLVNGVSSYNWTVPSGVTIINGQGTKNLIVSFSSSFTSGSISLTKSNGCGVSPAKFIPVSKVPPTPGLISGPTAICGLSTGTYSVASVTGASHYTWTLPAGVTSSLGVSPVITTTPSIPVIFGAFISGTISVKANNSCTASPARTLAISKAPLPPVAISGPTAVCGLSTASYSIAAVAGAVSYTWTLPTGVTSSLGASPITTTSLSIPVSFAGTFISTNISVKTNNGCTSSAAKSLTISRKPATPGTISGPLAICGLSTATYSITAVPGASVYTWTCPAGVSIQSGQGTTSIIVSISGSVGSGNLSVTSNNSCYTSTAKTLALSGCHAYTAISPEEELINTVAPVMYPNPSSGQFNISFSAIVNSELLIEIYNMKGNRIMSKTESVAEKENNFSYHPAELKRGSYLILMKDKKNAIEETKTLIIQ